MKKVHIRALGALLGCFITIFSLRISASAVAIVDSGYYGGEGDGTNISWTLDADGVLTVSGTGNMKGSTYPEPENAWSGWDHLRDSIRQVVVTEGVATIGNEAFRDCPNLTGVSFPNSIMWIRDSAFARCNALTTITIPKSVKSLGHFAFSDCSSLKSISFEEGFQSYGMGAFDGCASLTSLTFPKTVTNIYDLTFDNCKSLKSIYFCGKAPYVWEPASPSSASYTIYYISGMTGWTDSSAYDAVKETWHGKPLKTWTGDSDSGKIKLVSSSPLNGQVGFKKNDPLILTFSQDISQNPDWTKGSICIKSYMTDRTVLEIDSLKYLELGGAVDGTTMTIPGALQNLDNIQYYITIAPDVIAANRAVDGEVPTFSGISTRDALCFEAKILGCPDFKMGVDTFSFTQNIHKNGFNDNYYITDVDLEILKNRVGITDYIWEKYINYGRGYNSFYSGEHKGACFGIASVMALMKTGALSPSTFDYDAGDVFSMDWPKNNSQVASLIHYYHYLQYYKPFKHEDKGKTQREKTEELVEALIYGKNPVIFNFEFFELTKQEHAVLAYAINTDFDTNYYLVYVADPNFLVQYGERTGDPACVPDPGVLRINKSTMEVDTLTVCSRNRRTMDSDIGLYTTYQYNVKKVKSVISDLSIFEEFNLQKAHENPNNQSGASSESPFGELVTSANTFSVLAGTKRATVTNGIISGDLSLQMVDSGDGLNIFYLEGADSYTITYPDSSENRTTSLYYDGPLGKVCGAADSNANVLRFAASGLTSISGATEKSVVVGLINANLQSSSFVKVDSENSNICLRTETGKCKISSTSSLGSTVVEGINQNTSATVNAVISGSSADVYEGSIAHSNDLILEEDGEVLAFSDLPGKLGGSVGWNYVSEAGQIRFSGEMPKGGYVFAAFYADSRKLIEVRVVNSTDDILTVPSDCKTLDMFLLGEDMRPLCVNQTVIVQISNGAIPFDPVNKRLE